MLKHFISIILYMVITVTTAHADNWLSWSEFDEDGENIQIYLSRETGDKVGPVHKITHSGMNITPSLLITKNDIWIAWVDRANRLRYRLRYARVDPRTHNLLESGTIATSDLKTYSPVFAESAEGTPILAWSGWDNTDEEIRLAYFRNGLWSSEIKITQNSVPDTLPVFSASNYGAPTLSWERISDDKITIHSYNLASDTPLLLSDGMAKSTRDGVIHEHRNIAIGNSTVQRLPASLSSRQSLFFSGSRARTLE